MKKLRITQKVKYRILQIHLRNKGQRVERVTADLPTGDVYDDVPFALELGS